VKSGGTVAADGTKVLLRQCKERIVVSKCYVVYVGAGVVVVVMFNTWKASNCQR